MSGSVGLEPRLCDECEDCLEEDLEELFDGKLAVDFEEELEVFLDGDFGSGIDFFELLLAEVGHSKTPSSENSDVLWLL